MNNKTPTLAELKDMGAKFYYITQEGKRVNVTPYFADGLFAYCSCVEDGREHRPLISKLQFDLPETDVVTSPSI